MADQGLELTERGGQESGHALHESDVAGSGDDSRIAIANEGDVPRLLRHDHLLIVNSGLDVNHHALLVHLVRIHGAWIVVNFPEPSFATITSYFSFVWSRWRRVVESIHLGKP